MSGLPEGWETTTLGDVTHQRGEKINPQDQPELPFIGMDDIEGHTGRLLGQQRTGDFKSSVASFEVGDMLYGRLRPYLNKVWEAEFRGTASAEFIVMPKAAAITQAYLQKMLMGPDFIDFTGLVSTGDRPRVSFQSMSGFQFPLPPLAEQKRIVAKLDRLSARSGKAKEHLAAVQTLATRAKQATLAAAFRGELTADWRLNAGDAELDTAAMLDSARQGSIRMRRSKLPDRHLLPPESLPTQWRAVRFENFCSEVTDGTHHTPEYTEHGVAFISVKDIRNEEIHFDDCKFVSEDTHIELSKRCAPQAGDILLTKSGTIGRCAIVPPDTQFSLFVSVACIRLATEELVPAFFKFVLEYWVSKLDVSSEIIGTTIKNLHLQDIKALVAPVPTSYEQTEIVRRIETAFAKIDRMAEEASRAADLLNRLDQQLLAKAFRGELVPQDPSDEPASALLARIREARANAPKPKRRRKSAKA